MLYLDTFALTSGDDTFSYDPTGKNDHIICLKDSHVKSMNWNDEDDDIWCRLCLKKDPR